MNGAELLVAALENEGVRRIFGVPGEENLDVVEALRRSKIELVLTRHEQAAAFMAATHGRLTGRPGVCITTLGPGALNLDDRRGLRAARRDADGDDHRPEGRSEPQAGALSDRRHRRGHDAADQDGASDRQRRDHSRDGARGVPRRAAGAAGPGSSRTAGGHRAAAAPRHGAGPAASDRSADRLQRRARSGGRS